MVVGEVSCLEMCCGLTFEFHVVCIRGSCQIHVLSLFDLGSETNETTRKGRRCKHDASYSVAQGRWISNDYRIEQLTSYLCIVHGRVLFCYECYWDRVVCPCPLTFVRSILE